MRSASQPASEGLTKPTCLALASLLQSSSDRCCCSQRRRGIQWPRHHRCPPAHLPKLEVTSSSRKMPRHCSSSPSFPFVDTDSAETALALSGSLDYPA